MMEHILCLSYGKDSIASIHVILDILKWPLDRIVTGEMYATDTIPADLPEIVEFKNYANDVIKSRWGIEVEPIRCKMTFEEGFYRVFKPDAKNRPGEIYGWPFRRGPWCNSDIKMPIMDRLDKGNNIIYLGIAADEVNRFGVLSGRKKSPLKEAGWTEEMCAEFCKKNNLYSPVYQYSFRTGCWFCHNQSLEQLRYLRKNHPDLWAIMLKWDSDSPVIFLPAKKKKDGTIVPGKTIHDYDRRFAEEDNGKVPADRKFRWEMLMK